MMGTNKCIGGMCVDGALRRKELLALLQAQPTPQIGGVLAKRFDVSRQVIVQDVALLRADGHQVLATPQGYLMLPVSQAVMHTRVLACVHTTDEEMADELAIMVSCGVTVQDVSVEHPVYGELRGMLMIHDQLGIADFLRRLQDSDARPLANLTGGVHLHTLQAANAAALDQVQAALGAAGYLVV